MSDKTPTEQDRFSTFCCEFSELAKKIKFHAGEASKLRKRQKELKEPIKLFMKKHDSDEVEIKGAATIKYEEKERMKPLNKTSVKASLVKFFEEKTDLFEASTTEGKSELIAEWIYCKDNRVYSTTETVKTV